MSNRCERRKKFWTSLRNWFSKMASSYCITPYLIPLRNGPFLQTPIIMFFATFGWSLYSEHLILIRTKTVIKEWWRRSFRYFLPNALIEEFQFPKLIDITLESIKEFLSNSFDWSLESISRYMELQYSRNSSVIINQNTSFKLL